MKKVNKMADEKEVVWVLPAEDKLNTTQHNQKAEIKILIADDYEFMRQTIAGILRQTGYQKIFEAADGEAAISFLATNTVDLILCDWEMPVKSGLEVLQFVLADDRLKKTPFIMITAKSALSALEKANDHGIKHYIVKPFSPDILRKKIAAVLAKLHDQGVVT